MNLYATSNIVNSEIFVWKNQLLCESPYDRPIYSIQNFTPDNLKAYLNSSDTSFSSFGLMTNKLLRTLYEQDFVYLTEGLNDFSALQ